MLSQTAVTKQSIHTLARQIEANKRLFGASKKARSKVNNKEQKGGEERDGLEDSKQ